MFWKKYLNHVGPILVSRILAGWKEPVPEVAPYSLQLVNTRTKAAADKASSPSLERKIKFKAFDVSELNLEDLTAYITQRDKAIPDVNEASDHVVTYEMPIFLLRKILPLDDAVSAYIQKQPPILATTELNGTKEPLKRKQPISDEHNAKNSVSLKKICKPVKPTTPVTRPFTSLAENSASLLKQNETQITPSRHPLQHSPLGSTKSPAALVGLSEDIGLCRPQHRSPGQTPSERLELLLQSVAKQ
jgi:hypothetical protein